MSKSVTLRPHLSEKAYAQSEALNTYIFKIPEDTNSQSIKQAVEMQYGVSVTRVRLANIPGKSQRSIKRAGRSIRHFKRSDVRKAYVTLKDGDKLPLFAAVEETKPNKETK